MTSDRWRQVEDLCHTVLERPAEERAEFLAQACVGDDALQREVESLLAQESRAAEFMSTPAGARAGSALLDLAKGTLVGRRLGSYAIRSLLGVGGMGEVYRAYDDTLGREVAIKVLPPAFTADPERRARFDREARMLATLNHPHIGAIYGVEEADGVRGLVLELVEGETLAERIAFVGRASSGRLRAPESNAPGLPITAVLAIARQIASALEAAHEKGVVHRDLKPANIKITPDGVVKVLDFGLAKAANTDSADPNLGHSREGAIFGTAAYMSPEQTRGHSVDKRTDIWAFGCVLYEMLTGRLAFAGDTASDTIGKILEREPDWSILPADTPARIRTLLLRCLAKDPKQRVRDIGDVRIEIDAIDSVPPGVPGVTVTPPAPAKGRRAWLPWVALAALAAGVGVWEAWRPVTAPQNPLASARFTRFTDWQGTEGGAQISPDGKFVAFLADRDGRFDLWVSQVGTGRFVNLTADLPPLGVPGSVLRRLGFSGDGADIWFTSGPRQMTIPLTGGTPRVFLGEGAASPAWSPDGTRLVYFVNGSGDPLFVADHLGMDAKQIETNEKLFENGLHNHNPVWSPDGQWIYFVHGLDPGREVDIWRIRPSGESSEQLTERSVGVNFLAPIDPRTLLYTARAADGSGPWLWALDVASKTTRRLSQGLEHYTSLSASQDGLRVVATVSSPTANLWRVPLGDRVADDRDVQQYSVPIVRALAPRFGGTSLFLLSAGGTGDGLWRVQDGQAVEVIRGADAALSEPPAVSQDGQRVAIVLRKNGRPQLTVMSADGTGARTVAASITVQGTAAWSPDSAWIAIGGSDAQGPALFKIPAAGGEPVRVAAGDATNPVWSPDGSLIVYKGGPLVGGQRRLLGVRPDGTLVGLPDLRVRFGFDHRFLPNGKGVVYLNRDPRLGFWLLDLATNATRQLARLDDDGDLNWFDITPDGKDIVFDRSRENSDIVLIDLPK